MADGDAARVPGVESHNPTAADVAPGGWRYWLGLTLLVLSLSLPLIALVLVPLLGFPKDVNVVLFGLSLAGGPDLLLVLAIAAMGKENLDRILGKFLPWFKRIARWDTVTRRRYTLGLWVMVSAFSIRGS